MLDRASFHTVFSSIEEAFGKFPPVKRDRIYDFCQRLDPESFRKICVSFIDQDKKPGVSDFKIKANTFETKYEKPKEENLDCQLCLGTGVTFVHTAREDGFCPAAKCSCELGEREPWGLPQAPDGLKKNVHVWETLKKSITQCKEHMLRSKRIWEGLE